MIFNRTYPIQGPVKVIDFHEESDNVHLSAYNGKSNWGDCALFKIKCIQIRTASYMHFYSNTYRTFVVDIGPTLYEEFGNTLEPSSTGCS